MDITADEAEEWCAEAMALRAERNIPGGMTAHVASLLDYHATCFCRSRSAFLWI